MKGRRVNENAAPRLRLGGSESRQDRVERGLRDALRVAKDVGFPEAQHCPAELFKLSSLLSIALNVGFDLRDPIGGVCPAGESGFARAPVAGMPEIAIAEDDHSSFGHE